VKIMLSSLAVLLAASACGGPGPVADEAEDTRILGETGAAANEASAAVTDALDNGAPVLNEAEDWGSENGPPTPVSSISFPMEMRGRWGMVANDCQPGRSDAKGLITIGEQSVYFYESVAKLTEHRPAIATSFSGVFAFTGEGQKWEKVMTFTQTGDTLVRAEEEGRFTYKRCG
jgi:hypothetical protein